MIGAISQIGESLSRAGSPTGSMISQNRAELVDLVSDFGHKRRARTMSRCDDLGDAMSDVGGVRSRSASRSSSRPRSRATSIDRRGGRESVVEPARKQNDPILRKLEDIDPFELLHSTPDQLARQLGIARTAKVGNINSEIENIRTKSQARDAIDF